MSASRSRRGGIVLGLSLAALLVLGILAGAGLYCARQVTVHNGVSIDIPAGRLDIHSSDNFAASVAGIPVYPGAKPSDGHGGAVVEWSSRDGKEDKGLAVVEVITPDPTEKVVAYYRTRLPDWQVEQKDGAVEMEEDEGGNKRIVAIRRKSDGTHIGVASVGRPASN